MTAHLTDYQMSTSCYQGGPIRYEISMTYVSYEPIDIESIPHTIDGEAEDIEDVSMGQAMGQAIVTTDEVVRINNSIQFLEID